MLCSTGLCRSGLMKPSSFHGNVTLGSASLSKGAVKHENRGNLQSSSSSALHRYHSAPTSMFTCLAEKACPAEASQFLNHGNLGEYSSLSGDQKFSVRLDKAKDLEEYLGMMGGQYMNMSTAGNSTFIPRSHLSAIFEHGDEGPTVVVRSNYLNATDKNLHTPNFLMPPSASLQPGIIGKNSSSADVQSATITTDVEDTSLSMQISSQRNSDNSGTRIFGLSSEGSGRDMPVVSSSYMGRPCLGDDNDGLIRHSSSPAGLFSGFSAASFSSTSGKSLLPRYLSADGITGRKELGLMPDDGGTEWNGASFASDIQNVTSSAQRKRGRESEMKFFKPLQTTDLLNVASMNHGSQQSPDHCMVHGDDIMATDAVLFKSRAKRGCATHPRSIAERVRRTKISERVKTLTDLVPNLDRQAHTADMLDEVVEYVKQLQHRLQELLETARKCTCQTIEETSLVMK